MDQTIQLSKLLAVTLSSPRFEALKIRILNILESSMADSVFLCGFAKSCKIQGALAWF